MPKWNGGVIGVANNPTQLSAKGIWSLSEATKAIRAGLWPPSNAGADPYFENVTMLLSGDGTNGAQNNTFLDSSTNAFTITRNGNTTQGTFTPFAKPDGRWSNYFDGTGDYLTAGTNSAFAFGTGDFTIECWIYLTGANVNYRSIVSTRSSSGSGNGWVLATDASGNIYIYSNAFLVQASSAIVPNTWYHVAVCRASGTTTLYLNGVSKATSTTARDYTDSGLAISNDPYVSGEVWQGYITGMRLVKGTAVYTSAFTPPTAPPTAITNTSLLTCQSNRFIDNSTNAFAITRNGDVSVQTFSPFPTLTAYASGTNGGSGYFDGTGDYLDTASSSTELAMGTGAFTIEAWVYTADTSFMIACSTTTGGCGFGYNIDNGTQGLWVGRAGTGVDATSGVQLAYNAWNHVAVTRDGSNVVKFWVNGTQSGSNTTVTSNYGTSAQAVRIAADSNASLFNLNGYLSSVRITKGAALYTGTFTPSSTPLTTTVSSGTVSFLANFTNGGIVDAAMSNDLETVGNAQISTTQSKFGGASMYFDGSGDYLFVPNTNLSFNFGTGDFTIEGWVYLSATPSSNGTIIDTRSSDALSEYYIYVTSANKLNFIYSSSQVTSATSISNTTWTHFAITRSSGTIRLFINGTLDANTASYSGTVNAAATPAIGGGRAGGTSAINGYYFNGYIDDLRITKGYGRYTANFTAPVGAFVGFGD